MTNNKRVTARGLIIQNDCVVLMERWRDGLRYFSIPGGGVEDSEDLETALHRELDEELGVKVEVGNKILIFDTKDAIHHIFLCRLLSGEPELQPSSPEAAENKKGKNIFMPAWVPIKSFTQIPLIPWEPLREELSRGLTSGFQGAVKTITV